MPFYDPSLIQIQKITTDLVTCATNSWTDIAAQDTFLTRVFDFFSAYLFQSKKNPQEIDWVRNQRLSLIF